MFCVSAVCPAPHNITQAYVIGPQGPHTAGAQLQIVCDECYTGGGNMTCGKGGAWSQNPTCSSKSPKHFPVFF